MKLANAVILIIAHKETLTPHEEISLQQVHRVLGHYPIWLICPRGLDLAAYRAVVPEVQVDFIDPKWQASYAAFNQLKVQPFLYQRYRTYEYLLYYELDAFVFRDELAYWCEQGYDYIGAPWFSDYNQPQEDVNASLKDIGNGGFSLHRISSSLDVCFRLSWIRRPHEIWSDYTSMNWRGRIKHVPWLIRQFTLGNNTFHWFNDLILGEDYYWGVQVPRNFQWFRVATVEEALRFSFELKPAKKYELNQKTLPFGCHAWEKWDLDFWRPHIEKYGYRISHNNQ